MARANLKIARAVDVLELIHLEEECALQMINDVLILTYNLLHPELKITN